MFPHSFQPQPPNVLTDAPLASSDYRTHRYPMFTCSLHTRDSRVRLSEELTTNTGRSKALVYVFRPSWYLSCELRQFAASSGVASLMSNRIARPKLKQLRRTAVSCITDRCAALEGEPYQLRLRLRPTDRLATRTTTVYQRTIFF